MYRLLIALALLVPTPALAWWEYGHETVAKIALAKASPKTLFGIARLLRHAPELATPTCRLRSLEDASVWPDCIKGLKDRFSYAFSWHYQNVDVCKPFDLKTACKDGHCVSAQIERNARLLADKTQPPRERLMALAFLTHFVGDLHMPLHAGDRGDLGGNQVKATYGIYAGSRLNLHSVWDGYLAERAISTPPGGAEGLLGEAAVGMEAGSVEDWSRESWQVSRDVAYTTALGDPCGAKPERAVLDDAKIATLIAPTRLQVLRGGVRLGRMLNEALK